MALSFWTSLSSSFTYSPLRRQPDLEGSTSSSPSPPAARPSMAVHIRQGLSWLATSKRGRLLLFLPAVLFLTFLAATHYEAPIGIRIPSFAPASVPNLLCPTANAAGGVAIHAAGDVDWSRFAYVQYVTNSAYLCNSVMLFETLHRLGSRADRLMMYPAEMMLPDEAEWNSNDERLLIKARDAYDVKLMPITVQRRPGQDSTWAESFTKLMAFNQTQYDRVLHLDSDATILQTMDELFLLPACPVAMPRAYWLFPEKKILSSQIMLLQPSATEFERVMDKVQNAAGDDYDMEIVNQLYVDSAMILPHRPYNLLTGEFRDDDHHKYLGSDREVWDPVAAFNEAKFLHFSDWPVPKPWLSMTEQMKTAMQPKCVQTAHGESCAARDLWNGFYSDFTDRRKRVCHGKSRR